MKTLVLTLSLLLGARAFACDPTVTGGCSADGLAVMPMFGMVTAGSIGLAGLITATGGAANLRSKGWRQANYVLGTLSLVEALVIGSIAAATWDPQYNAQFSDVMFGCAAGALAIGMTDIGLAIGSAVKSSRPTPRMTVVPLASRDMGGMALTGRF